MASKTIKQIDRTLTGLTDIDLELGYLEGDDLSGSTGGSYKVKLALLKEKFNEGAVTYVGTWDASTGFPPSLSPIKGQYWVVSVSGTTNLSGIFDWQVKDWAIYNGATWDKVDNSDQYIESWGVKYLNALYPTISNVEEALDLTFSGLSSLSTSIDSGLSYAISTVDSLSTVVSSGISQIYDELSTILSIDFLLSTAISAEISDRISGDTSLSTAISSIISLSGDTVIGTPTDGTYSDGIFPFTPTTKLADAVDDFNEMFLLLAPTPPSAWNSTTMTLGSTFSARALSTGSSVAGITSDDTPTFTVTVPLQGLSDPKFGNLTFDVDSVVQETYGVTGTTNKSTGVIRYVSGDPYIGQSGKAGFWSGFTSASAVSTTLTPSSSQKTANYIHSTKGTLSRTFYLDSPLSVTISNLIATVPTMTRYISGVPSLASTDSITNIGFLINDVSSYFYSSTSVWQIVAGLVASQTGDPDSIPTSNGEVGSVSSTSTTVLSNQFSDLSFFFSVRGRNSMGTYGVNETYIDSAKRVDTVSDETERLTSGTGNYPVSFGSVFTSSSSLSSVNTMELQLINAYYKWPVNIDYSSYDSGPNYVGITTGDNIGGTEWRWATFSLGTKPAVNNITITIPSATIGTAWNSIKMYVKIGASGWVDASLAQNVSDPYNDGDGALDIGNSTPYYIRRVTFGTTARSGAVYARIGIKASDTAFQFKKPTMA